jgi:hypothetical protein
VLLAGRKGKRKKGKGRDRACVQYMHVQYVRLTIHDHDQSTLLYDLPCPWPRMLTIVEREPAYLCPLPPLSLVPACQSTQERKKREEEAVDMRRVAILLVACLLPARAFVPCNTGSGAAPTPVATRAQQVRLVCTPLRAQAERATAPTVAHSLPCPRLCCCCRWCRGKHSFFPQVQWPKPPLMSLPTFPQRQGSIMSHSPPC